MTKRYLPVKKKERRDSLLGDSKGRLAGEAGTMQRATGQDVAEAMPVRVSDGTSAKDVAEAMPVRVSDGTSAKDVAEAKPKRSPQKIWQMSKAKVRG